MLIDIKPNSELAYYLMHEGSKAFADLETNGIRIDREYFERQQTQCERKIAYYENKIAKTKEGKFWRRKYGTSTNLDSDAQLRDILFHEFGFEATAFTEKDKKEKVDIEALHKIGIDMTDYLMMRNKYCKASETYIGNILAEANGEFLHPFFNLSTAATYRSSSSNYNLQNIPARDKLIKRIIRRGFISRLRHMICETDFKGSEVTGAACYHQDPRMIEYLEDDSKDLHRDMAMQIFFLDLDEVTKDIRHMAKNKFVFPSYFGSMPDQIASNMWDAADDEDLEDGTPLKEHLKDNGIRTHKAFERHIEEIVDDFWNRRFKVYNRWKKKWFENYLKRGYFVTLTGFKISGVMKRTEVINYPIQGSSFHMLLWSLIELNKWIKKQDMKTKLMGQIHDSILADIYEPEKGVYVKKVKSLIEEDLFNEFEWLIVPITAEIEIAPVNATWYDKEEI